MSNPIKRTLLIKAAVFSWVDLGANKIVVSDATDKKLLDDLEVEMLKDLGIEVEQLFYPQNDEKIIEKGKGYGEGALISFTLKNSRLLEAESHFYKCTEKVYCRNFDRISSMTTQNNIGTIAWQEPFSNTIDTRFFFTSKLFCEKVIISAYEQINVRSGRCTENVMFELARRKMQKGISLRPLLSGFSGSLDKIYFDEGLGFIDSNYPCWVEQ